MKPPSHPPPRKKLQAKATVLLVEPEANMRQFLHDELLRANYHPIKAANAMEALRIVRKEAVDVVVSDIVLPHMDGIEMVALIREIPRLADLRIIVCSAARDKDQIVSVAKLRCQGYLVKPVAVAALLDKIKAVLAASPDAASAADDAAGV